MTDVNDSNWIFLKEGDIWQEGDCYGYGGKDTSGSFCFVIGGEETGVKPGDVVDKGQMIYRPRRRIMTLGETVFNQSIEKIECRFNWEGLTNANRAYWENIAQIAIDASGLKDDAIENKKLKVETQELKAKLKRYTDFDALMDRNIDDYYPLPQIVPKEGMTEQVRREAILSNIIQERDVTIQNLLTALEQIERFSDCGSEIEIIAKEAIQKIK